MTLVGTSIAGLKKGAVYQRICCDALRGHNVVIILALSQVTPVGYVIAVIDWRAYWRRFLPRCPLLATVILAARFRKSLFKKAYGPDSSAEARPRDQSSARRTWTDSSRTIAKVVHIGVAPDKRGRGIAEQLYLRLFQELKHEGVVRIDATMSADNSDSIRLHKKTGWTLERTKTESFFGTRDI